MSGGCEGSRGADPCGWEELGPRRPNNRPGLSEITYRIGRHSDFLSRMLREVPREVVTDSATGQTGRPLKALSSRTTDDPTVALMDAWASTLDVLAFYQERIANEGYIRSTKERVSALELARTIGYELDPGVAASTRLAFTVESADDPFRVLEIPVGTQVMSVPQESGELPQVFETVESIRARAEWNEIRARTEREQNLAIHKDGTLYLLDVDNSFDFSEIDSSDVIEIRSAEDEEDAEHVRLAEDFYPVTPGLDLVAALEDLEEDSEFNQEIDPVIHGIAVDHVQLRGTGLGLEEGARILIVGKKPQDDTTGEEASTDEVKALPFRISTVEEDTGHSLTRVDVTLIDSAPRRRKLLRLRLRPPKLRPATVITRTTVFNQTNVNTLVKRRTWPGAALSAFVKTQSWPRVKLMKLFRRPPETKSPDPGTVEPGIYVLRQSAGFFGNTAPKWETLAKSTETRGGAQSPAVDPYEKSWEAGGAPRTVWKDSQGEDLEGADVYLEREVKEIVPGEWAIFEAPQKGVGGSFSVGAAVFRVGGVSTQSRSDFALSGKTTGLILSKPDRSDLTDSDKSGVFNFRTATARVASEFLPLAGIPMEENIEAETTELMLDNLYLDLEPGRAVSVSGERSDAPGVNEAETLIIDDVVHTGGFTRLILEAGTGYEYKRTTVTVNANVALATHGESIEEPLGDGDATQPNQAFALAKPPLTFISAATETGSATTLTIRVNDIVWTQIPSLYDAGPEDEVYMVRIDDDKTTRVVFGDGVHGKRLPTGPLIVTASYRSGMGTEGEVPEETLILLKKRPLGVRSVTNASPATGAAGAETLEDARTRAPRSVRTLGRIVSLTDHEDFARTFAGIGKAQATAIWRGMERIVHVTVAPVTDSVFGEDSETLAHLRDAMNRLRDPARPLIVAPHLRRLFEISANVFCRERYLEENVEEAIRKELETAFGYENRCLAQPVSAAEILATIQRVDGVDHVDIEALLPYREDETETEELEKSAAPPKSVLLAYPAHLADPGDPPDVLAAELLTVLPSAITLTMESVNA